MSEMFLDPIDQWPMELHEAINLQLFAASKFFSNINLEEAVSEYKSRHANS
jgi:hypothetical protein